MEVFTSFQLKRINQFINRSARLLDKRLFSYYFQKLHSDDVAISLATYQNADGGFGNAIEPDFRLPDSSPMATTIGLQYAVELKLQTNHPIVMKAIQYLLDSYNDQEKRWHPVPKEVNLFPHAPWWHVNEATNNAGVESNWANPNAEIVSYLIRYQELVPHELLQQLKTKALQNFTNTVDDMEMHDLLCYIKLFEVLPEAEQMPYLNKLQSKVKAIVQTTKEAWENYGPKPLTFVPSPAALLYPILKEEINLNLAYELDQLTDEGCWAPNWAWGQYEDTWAQAKEEWKGYLTVKMVKSLNDFGRIKKASE